MTLHTLNVSPASAAFLDCLRFLNPGDALLLLGDGVYAALSDSDARAKLDSSGASLFVLREDALTAGVQARIEGATVIDINGFVELSERCPRQLAWY